MRAKLLFTPLTVALLSGAAPAAHAMCGGMFPIRPPNRPTTQVLAERIVNRSSKVALLRVGDQTVMTMSNDVETDATEFAMVVPVPTSIKRDQVRVVSGEVFDRLEQISGPRLIERRDPDPCPRPMRRMAKSAKPSVAQAESAGAPRQLRAKDYGVKVESYYEVGEYGIAILKAEKGSGLMAWLNAFHYGIPEDAVPVLNSYIKQGNRFFVARVNLKKKPQKGQFLRPIQVRYQTPRFGLPIRLGTVNAVGPQELTVFAASDRGRIETLNYPTHRMPTDQEVPLFVRGELDAFYKAVFDNQVEKHGMKAVFLERAGFGMVSPGDAQILGLDAKHLKASPQQLTLSRLHFRYDRQRFPEDLVFQETGDRSPFEVRYTVTVPSTNTQCPAGRGYLDALEGRKRSWAKNAVALTGWSQSTVFQKMGLSMPKSTPAPPPPPPPPQGGDEEPWWKKLTK